MFIFSSQYYEYKRVELIPCWKSQYSYKIETEELGSYKIFRLINIWLISGRIYPFQYNSMIFQYKFSEKAKLYVFIVKIAESSIRQ